MNVRILILFIIRCAGCCLPFFSTFRRDECIKDGDSLGLEYRGRKQYTKSGKLCQRWDSQVPHKHRFTDFGQCEENYCRNPDWEPGPWCYTTDPGTRWELCEIPDCPKKEPPRIEYIYKDCCDQNCMNSIECKSNRYICTLRPFNVECVSKKTDSLRDTYSEPNIPLIAGSAVGGVLGFILITVICCCWWCSSFGKIWPS